MQMTGPPDDDEFDREFELSVFGGPTAFTSKEDENPRTIKQLSPPAQQRVPGSASIDVGGENVRTHSSEAKEASPVKDSPPAAEANHPGNMIGKHLTFGDVISISCQLATLCIWKSLCLHCLLSILLIIIIFINGMNDFRHRAAHPMTLSVNHLRPNDATPYPMSRAVAFVRP